MKKASFFVVIVLIATLLTACGHTSSLADVSPSSGITVDAIVVKNGVFSTTPQSLIDALNTVNTDPDAFPQIGPWENSSTPINIIGESLTMELHEENGSLKTVSVYFYDGDNDVSVVNKAGYLIGDLLKLFADKNAQKYAEEIENIETMRSGSMTETCGDVMVSFSTYGVGGNKFIIQPK